MSRRDCTTGGISLLANGKGTSTRISTVAWLGFLCFLFSYFILLFGDKIACLRLFELNWTGMESRRRSHRQSPLYILGGPRAKEKMTDWKLTLANAPPATRSSAFVLHSLHFVNGIRMPSAWPPAAKKRTNVVGRQILNTASTLQWPNDRSGLTLPDGGSRIRSR